MPPSIVTSQNGNPLLRTTAASQPSSQKLAARGNANATLDRKQPSNSLLGESSSAIQNRRREDETINNSDEAPAASQAAATTPTDAAANPLLNSTALMSPYGGGGMYGGGMYGSMYGGGGMMMPPMLGGPLSGLNQFLFGVQTVLFSLGQAVQIVGMNTQAFQQLLESATTMLDHALATYRDMRALEQQSREGESEEDMKRRRRLKALRWAMIVGVTYMGYRFIRRILRARLRRKLLLAAAHGGSYNPAGATNYSGAAYNSHAVVPPSYGSGYAGGGMMSPYNPAGYHGSGGYSYPTPGMGMNPYGGAGYY